MKRTHVCNTCNGWFVEKRAVGKAVIRHVKIKGINSINADIKFRVQECQLSKKK